MKVLARVLCYLTVTWIHSAYVTASKEIKECSPFPFVELDNGQIIRTSNQKYRFKCDKGFVPSIETVRCYRGKWTSVREPKCLKPEGLCDDPPKVDNAIIHGEDRAIGSTVIYTCNSGFQLIGNGEMTCSSSEYWEGRTPTCMDEKEPLKNVADRLQNSFVNELGSYTEDAVNGKLLDRGSLANGLDLVMVIDRSSSIDPVQIENAKKFVIFLLDRFGVRNEPRKEGGTQAAVMTFGTDVHIVFNMNDYNITGPLAARQAVGTIQPNGGGTNVEGALTMVIIQVSPYLRKKSKKALFLMTDGEPNVANPEITAEDMAKTLRTKYNFEIFTVGIGRDINTNFLAEVASKPPLSHVFTLADYKDLEDIMEIIEDSKPPAPPTSRFQCGYETPKENSPWLAIVYVPSGVGRKNMTLCGGVLICSEWVLTAASCLFNGKQRIPIQDVFVTVGEKDLVKKENNEKNFYLKDMKLHSKFDISEPLENNLALLKLNTPAERYRPACLPRIDRSIPLYQDVNANLSISGWGLSSSVPTHPSGESVLFKMTSISASLSEEDACPGKKSNMPLFCAGENIQTCLGLMGSPIISTDPSTKFNHVIGVVAGRAHCRKSENQYIELTKFLDWINDHTGNCQREHWDELRAKAE